MRALILVSLASSLALAQGYQPASNLSGVQTNTPLCLDQSTNTNCIKSDGTNTILTTTKRVDIGPVVTSDFFGTTLATQLNTASPGNTVWHLLDTTTSTYPRFQWIFSGAPTYATDANRYLGWIFNLDRGLTDHAGWKDAAGNNLIKCRGWTDAGVNQDWTCQGATITYDWGGVAYTQRKGSFNITMQAQTVTAVLINETTAPSADSLQVLASDGTTKRFSLNAGTLTLQTGLVTGVLTLSGSATLNGGLTASGSVSNDFSGSTGTFKTSSGANTLSGPTTASSTKNVGTLTLSGGTNTATVTAGRPCVCTDTTLPTNLTGCSVSSTTLTVTAIGASDNVSYICL